LLLIGFFLACAGSLRSAETAAAPSLITASDLFQIKQVESPALSPDGKWVAYVVRSIEPKPAGPAEASAKEGTKDDWTYRTQLWLAATDGQTAPRQLTFGYAGNASPAWSPDGARIAFVRSIEKEKPQLYLLPLAGGEAQPLTKLETGATSPRWSPDGTKILFTSSLSYAQVRDGLGKAGKNADPAWSTEKPGRKANDTANWALKKKDEKTEVPRQKSETKTTAPKADLSAVALAKPDGTSQEMREWLAKEEADANPRVTDRLNFLGEGDLAVEPTFSQFYTIEARDGAEPVAVTLGYEGYTGAEWLADGKGLVCVGKRKLDEHPDRSRFTSLYTIDLATGAAKVLLEEPGINYAAPLPSPDGKWIAFAMTPGGEFSFEQRAVAIVPAGGGKVEMLSAPLDRAVANLKWAADSSAVYFTAASRGHFPLYRVGLAHPEVQALTAQADWGVNDFDVSAGTLVQAVTHPGNPSELYAGPADDKTATPLTTHNSGWLKHRKLSAYEPHSLVTKEGLTVDFWTLKPTEFDAKKKYPLLVEIHGGPSAMWGPGEASMWHEFQYFAARGYAIVFSNPRGSGGYGRDFQRANFKDWGAGPMSDVLAAADFAAKEPFVDKSRQVVTGGSYGGYLTAWIVGHDHRFKAAVAVRGVYDLSTFYGEGNAWFLLPLYFGGFPWQKDVRPVLDRESPLTYVENITTPLLIKHGDVDFRTGVIQSQMLYKSLKQLGRPVEYVRYPRATHELSRSGEPKQRLDRLVRFEEFFRRYIGEN
jgi:dipeptidyl aminopeptidase/acylaminoacyl peptidase